MERRTRGMANRTGRTMNSAMNISLPVELHEQLRDLAWQERLPLSHLCRELLETGMRLREEKRARGRGRGEPMMRYRASLLYLADDDSETRH